VSVIRHNPNPWLADHVIFFCYRWLAWAAGALLLWQGHIAGYGWVLLLTGGLNIPATLFAQPYVRVARRTPAIMGLDIVYSILVLLGSGGWDSPFALYAYSSLVLPALLFGWRGGVMAGLSFVSMIQVALWVAGRPLADMVMDSQWLGLALMVAVPPIFSCSVPAVVDLLRRSSARRRSRRAQGRVPFANERVGREDRADLLRFTPVGRNTEDLRENRPTEAPLAVQATKIRATEPGVEDLRRVLFAPLPATSMELAAILDLLSMRFSQHTGVATRVALLGRTRQIHHANRGVLVRLVQEALLNVQQHAHAASTVLMLRYDALSIALLIQDDGVGLLDGTYERPGLHALRAMHYRVAELGGRLDVFETEGGGVTVRATMPLE
jgi:hypothetical protein